MIDLSFAGDLHLLLLRAAGRIPDAELTGLRGALAEGHLDRCAVSLAGRFLMTTAELELLRRLAPDIDLPRPAADPVDEPPGAYFIPVPPGMLGSSGVSVPALLDVTGDPSAVDRYDLAVLAALDLDEVVGVWRGWRVTVWDDGAAAARVYVIESAATADELPAVTAAAQQALIGEGDTSSQVEVYGPGLPLPAYQRTARAHAALIWASAPATAIRVASPGPVAVTVDGDERTAALEYLRAAPIIAATPGTPAVRTDGQWVWLEALTEDLDRHGALADPALLEHLRAVEYNLAVVDAVDAHRALSALQHRAPGAAPVQGAETGMDAGTARVLAAQKLVEVQDPDTPLRLADEPPAEYAWCWVFPFNSEKWFRTGTFTSAVLSGPVVVDKDGGAVWIAPSAPPLEEWLNGHAAERGFAPVPVPDMPDLW